MTDWSIDREKSLFPGTKGQKIQHTRNHRHLLIRKMMSSDEEIHFDDFVDCVFDTDDDMLSDNDIDYKLH